MHTINVPDDLDIYSQISVHDISFIHYHEASPVGRNLISFGRCAISFILSGNKEFFRESENTSIQAGQGIVIPQGNAIIAERRLNATEYSSLVIFFPLSLATEFVCTSTETSSGIIPVTAISAAHRSFLPFEVTNYLSLYIKNIVTLIGQQAKLTYPVMRHKLQELLLVLGEMHPLAFMSLWNTTQSASELKLRAIVESSISKGLTLEELAFLANRSLASFKRDFEKAYGTSPGKYLSKRKMEIACHALQSGKSVAETAEETGYESLSNFTVSFKKWTGYTPKEYQSRCLLIEPITI